MSSPTQRTLERCRKHGWTVAIAEKWNAHVRRRFDLFGFIDIVALADGTCIGIQATSGSHAAHRVTKIREECGDAARAWLACGNRIEVWAWRKQLIKRGGKATRWEPRIVEVTAEDLAATKRDVKKVDP